MGDKHKVRIKQSNGGTIDCCSQMCDASCPHYHKCEQVKIVIEREEAEQEDPMVIAIENTNAVAPVVMGLLSDGWTVQLFERPKDFAVKAWRDEPESGN